MQRGRAQGGAQGAGEGSKAKKNPHEPSHHSSLHLFTLVSPARMLPAAGEEVDDKQRIPQKSIMAFV